MTAMRHKRWDEHDDEFIRDNWTRLGGRRVAEKLGRSLTATQQRAHMLGVKSRPGVPTREEFERLCAEHTIPEIARQCGVSYEAVWQWTRKWGCTPQAAKKGGRRQIERERMTPRRLVRIQPNMLDWPDWIDL